MNGALPGPMRSTAAQLFAVDPVGYRRHTAAIARRPGARSLARDAARGVAAVAAVEASAAAYRRWPACSAASISTRPCWPAGPSPSAACWRKPMAACSCWRWRSGWRPRRRCTSPPRWMRGKRSSSATGCRCGCRRGSASSRWMRGSTTSSRRQRCAIGWRFISISNEIVVRDAEEFPIDGAGDRGGARASAVDCSRAGSRSRRSAPRLRRSASSRCARRCWRCASPAPARRLAGHAQVEQDDIALAARLVLAPRALMFPQAQEPASRSRQPEPPSRVDADNERR